MEPQENSKEEIKDKEKAELLERLTKEQNERLARREENLKYASDIPELPKNLISKIDRIQKFITKLKNLKEDSKDSLLEEMSGLNLTRYINEIVEIMAKSRLQVRELLLMTEICVAMHQRYKDFALALIPSLQKQFQQCVGCSDEPSKALKRRQILRLMTELFLRGVLNDITKIGKCLKEVIVTDKLKEREKFACNISLLANYLKQYGEILFGITSKKTRLMAEAGGYPEFERHQFVKPAQKNSLLAAFKVFFLNACEFMKEEHAQLEVQAKKMRESLEEIDIDKEIEKKYVVMRTTFDKNWSMVVQLADALDFAIPQQMEERISLVATQAQPKSEELQPGEEKSLFEDEMQRSFYRDLVELKVEPKAENEKEGDKSVQEKENFKQEMDELLKKMPNCATKEEVDEIAQEFAKLSNKKTRKMMVKAIFNVPRTALPLIPLYARLTATLCKVWKDVGNSLVDMLEKEFNELTENKDAIRIETKIRNIRFLGELTKFEICNPNIIFNCMKVCLEDFLEDNIDVVCHLLETAGVYLAKLPSTRIRLNNTIDLMWKTSKTKSLSAQVEANIENVYYLCKHPERYGKRQKKNKPILEQYIKHLIFERLTPETFEKVAGLVCCLPLDNEEVVAYLQKCIMKLTFYGKFTSMDVVSCFIACLKKSVEFIAIRVVDNLLEDILQGLEKNDYKENQHRVLTMCFLGELYGFTVINSDLIFTVLNILIDFNNEHKYPDSEDDGFRVRMVCTLLEACGSKFGKGERKAKLDRFLRYFERYMLAKSHLSLDLQFMVMDVYEMLRPDMTLCKTYEEAVEECKKIESGAIVEEEVKEKIEEVKNEDMSEEESKLKEKGEENEEAVHVEEENLKEYDRGNITNKLDDELNALIDEYQKEAKKQGVLKKVDVPVPVIKKESEPDTGMNKFAVMIKKGAKQVMKKLTVPSDSKMAVAHQRRMDEEEEERHRMKELTMHMIEREETLESKGEHAADAKPKPRLEDQIARGKKKVHFNYKDFDS